MSISLVSGSAQTLQTGTNTLSEIGGGSTWAISFWVSLPAAGSLSSDNRAVYLTRFTTGPSRGYFIWFYNQASWGGRRFSFEGYNGSGGGLNDWTSSALDAAFNSGFHHFLVARINSTQLSLYMDGVLITTITGTANSIDFPAASMQLEYGPASYGSTRAPTGDMANVKMFKDPGMPFADMAKIIYESQGNDNLTDGLVTEHKMDAGVTGSVMTAERDLSTAPNNIVTVNNSPTYLAAPLN